jgi:hypothetical protein
MGVRAEKYNRCQASASGSAGIKHGGGLREKLCRSRSVRVAVGIRYCRWPSCLSHFGATASLGLLRIIAPTQIGIP